MKIKYDQSLDVLYIRLSDAPIEESDSEKPGIIIDYDENGAIVAIEILNASQKMPLPTKFEYEVA
ncbi:MAG: DUF2283 domain-containing protein [Saprospiraceae bacterium]|nr:DUF2283 domain-containing protein [Saprospiraceae bacterium]